MQRERERERGRAHGDLVGTVYSVSPEGKIDSGSGTGLLPLDFQASWTTLRYSVASFASNPVHSMDDMLWIE